MSEQQSVLSPEERLVSELDDAEYRRGFVEGHAKDTIAFQLRALRVAREWDQRDVAERIGNRKLQPMISRYENPDYGRYSVSTLLELAAAFDVALLIRFAPFSELAEWDLSDNHPLPVSFDKDTKLQDLAEKGRQSMKISQEDWLSQGTHLGAGATSVAASAKRQGQEHMLASISGTSASGVAAA